MFMVMIVTVVMAVIMRVIMRMAVFMMVIMRMAMVVGVAVTVIMPDHDHANGRGGDDARCPSANSSPASTSHLRH